MATAPILAVCLLVLACKPSPRATPKQSASVATDPHALDSLAKLARLQLTAEDPHAVQQLMVCEGIKVYAKLGEAEADIRLKGMMDTIYKTRADSIASDRAVSKLFGTVTTANSFFCDSLAAANSKRRADSLAQHSK
jgi:hypothetical protein